MFGYTLLLAVLSTVVSASYSLRQVYQFPSPPVGRYFNVENIAYRKNGLFLITIASGPSLYTFNPLNPIPQLVANGPASVDSLTGLAETYPGSDVWVVAGGKFGYGPQVPGGVAGVPGTSEVYVIDLNQPSPAFQLVTKIPEAVALDGAAAPGNRDIILIADGGLGAIWSVNVKTGAYNVALQDPLFQNTPGFSLGINGLKAKQGVLYFTNSAQRFYGSVPLGYVQNKGIVAGGPVKKIASAPIPANQYTFDDFALDNSTTAYIATPYNAITTVTLAGNAQAVANVGSYNNSTNSTGSANSTMLVNPTSCAFDHTECNLYITTAGRAYPPGKEQSGGIYVMDICTSWRKFRGWL